MIKTYLWITDIDPCIHTWPALYLGHKIRTLYRHLSKHLSKHLSLYIIDRSGGVPALVNKRWHSQFVHANLPIGRWTSVVDPHGENGSNPLLPLTLTTITSMQIQNKQDSTPRHVHSTMQPPSKITVCKMYSCQYQPVKIINQICTSDYGGRITELFSCL